VERLKKLVKVQKNARFYLSIGIVSLKLLWKLIMVNIIEELTVSGDI